MVFKIEPAQVKKTVVDLEEINSKLRSVQQDVTTISHCLERDSASFWGISNKLTDQADALDLLVTKFAAMEDGLERAVELYLQCEKRLTDRAEYGKSETTASVVMASKSGGIKGWWSNVVDWFGTGVWNDSKKADRVRNDKAMASQLKKLLKKKRYKRSTWKKATVKERKKILLDLFEDIQKIYGVSVSKLVIEPIECEGGIAWGYYNDAESLICINEDVLSNPKNYKKIMDTMMHEMRHAYQHEVVRNPKKFKVDEKTVEEWSKNIKDYKTVEDDGYAAYRDQPIEKDAREFASWVV